MTSKHIFSVFQISHIILINGVCARATIESKLIYRPILPKMTFIRHSKARVGHVELAGANALRGRGRSAFPLKLIVENFTLLSGIFTDF